MEARVSTLLSLHYSMAIYRRRLKMPSKVIKMPLKTF
jgi:hypothetical protein